MAEYSAVARPYARAVFELAQQGGELAAWSKMLAVAGQVVDNDEFRSLLNSPSIERDSVVSVLVDVCAQADDGLQVQGQPAMLNFLRLLAENRRLSALPEISLQFEQLRANVENTVEVVMTSAAPVSPEQQAKLAAALKRRFGREVNLRFELDESLIGGARLQADDLVIDGSVRTGLDKLSSALVN